MTLARALVNLLRARFALAAFQVRALWDPCAKHGVKWNHATMRYICECGKTLPDYRMGDKS